VAAPNVTNDAATSAVISLLILCSFGDLLLAKTRTNYTLFRKRRKLPDDPGEDSRWPPCTNRNRHRPERLTSQTVNLEES
jgi:hypothetical protein